MQRVRKEPSEKIERYLLQIDRMKGLSEGTTEYYGTMLYAFQRQLGMPLEMATRELLRRWAESLKVGANARYTYITAMRSFFRWLQEDDLFREDNPASTLHGPKRPKGIPNPVPPKIIAQAMTYATERGWNDVRFIIALMVFAGCRAAEVCKLRPASRVSYPDDLLVIEGKGGKTRQVPFTASLKYEWDLYIQNRGEARVGFILLRRDGKSGMVNPNRCSGLISMTYRSMELTYTGHRQRKTYATELGRAPKSDVRVVQQLLGHESLETTQIYMAPDMDKARQMAESIMIPGISQPPPEDNPPDPWALALATVVDPAVRAAIDALRSAQAGELPPIPRQRNGLRVIQGGGA